jgi:hypothetical protein
MRRYMLLPAEQRRRAVPVEDIIFRGAEIVETETNLEHWVGVLVQHAPPKNGEEKAAEPAPVSAPAPAPAPAPDPAPAPAPDPEPKAAKKKAAKKKASKRTTRRSKPDEE